MKKWTSIKLGNLLTESKIISTNPDTNRRIRVKLNVGGVEKRPDTSDKEGATKYYIRKAGQFIYGKQNLHKGAFGIVPKELDGYESSSDIPSFDVDNSCYPEWIFYFFKQGNFYLQLEAIAKGVGSKRIQNKQLFDVEILLPEKSEQKQILSKIHNLQDTIAIMSNEIDAQFKFISVLRKRTLQEAIEGKFTEKWRRENSNSADNGKKLLNILRRKKKELILRKQLPNQISYPEIKDSESKFDLPLGWTWAHLENILQSLRYGTSKKCDYNLGETGVLRIPNIVDGKIDFNDIKSTNLNEKEQKDLSLLENDILMIRSNGSTSLVGKTAVIEPNAKGYAFAGYLMRLRPFEQIDSEYLHIVLESPLIRNIIENSIRTTSGVKNINSNEVFRLQIPLPPTDEQKAIVKKVNSLLSSYKEIEEKIRVNQESAYLFELTKLSEYYGNQRKIIETKKKNSEDNDSQMNKLSSVILTNNNVTMELYDLLLEHGKLSAFNLWQLSLYNKDIDAFYAELKIQVEEKLTIKESDEKGFLELVQNEN